MWTVGTLYSSKPVVDVCDAPRLTDVLSRIYIDLEPLLDEVDCVTLKAAATACVNCRYSHACDRWIARTQEGEENTPPTFCPAIRYMTQRSYC